MLIETNRALIKIAVIQIYTYEKCDTCRKALRFLAEHGAKPHVVPIREQPPTKAELKRMLAFVGGDLRRLFNTSGRDYKELGMKDRLPKLSEAEALDLLSKNGNLVKRPFLLTERNGTVGFNEVEWWELFVKRET
jgi:arsenate reductase